MDLREALEPIGCEVLESDRTSRGMGASIAAGVEASAQATGWIVALGDMPMVRPETKHMTGAPSAYLRRFHYDTISHHVPLMMYLVKLVGADRVVLGSDHPADMSIAMPPAFVASLPDVPVREKDLILGGNAERLLRM